MSMFYVNVDVNVDINVDVQCTSLLTFGQHFLFYFFLFFFGRIQLVFGEKNPQLIQIRILHIRVEKVTQIEIQVLFDLIKSPEYEYKYYRVSLKKAL